jgi:hypothetical protein
MMLWLKLGNLMMMMMMMMMMMCGWKWQAACRLPLAAVGSVLLTLSVHFDCCGPSFGAAANGRVCVMCCSAAWQQLRPMVIIIIKLPN